MRTTISLPRSAVAILVTVGIFLPAQSFAEAEDHAYCAIVQEARAVVEDTRGTKFKGDVSCRVLSKAAIGQYVKVRIQEEVGPCDLEYEGIVLRGLGMFAESFNYPQAVHSVYESALGGFYDPRTKSFSMADWTPPTSQRGVAVHELVHAIQDQYWDLERFVNSKSFTGDEVLARMSLVEGEATALVLDTEQRSAGQGALSEVGLQAADGFEDGFSSPFSADYPEALQQLVQFPYTAGLRFVTGLLRQRGYLAVDAAFTSPPRSTEEILHAEKRGEGPADFSIPSEATVPPEFGASLYHDTLGEFVTRVILRETSKDTPAAIQGAQGWGGDRVDLFRRSARPGEYLIVWQTNWDAQSDTTEFLRAFLGEKLAGLGVKRRMSQYRELVVNGQSSAPHIRLIIKVTFVDPLTLSGARDCRVR